MKTVLILGNSSGGLYDFRNEFVQGLLKKYRVIISLPDDVKTNLLAQEGAEVVHTDMNRRGVNPLQDGKLYGSYKALIKKYKPDVCLTYTIKPNVYGGYACAKAGVPCIPTVTGLGSAFQKSGVLKVLVENMYRIGLKHAACVFFQNEENKQYFEAGGIAVREKSRLVSGSGVNLDTWQLMPYPSGDITNFMFVGRVMKEKGIEEFLEAARVLHGEKIVFSIAGYCDEDYQEVLDESTKRGEIIQLGFHKDMHELYERCSAVVLPTYHEGMNNVLMEASACGRPVIATSISGCREIFEDGVTGFGFAPKSADALIMAIKKFLLLPKTERAAMGEAAREKMKREFDRKKVAAAYLAEVDKIVSGRTSQAKH